MRIHHVVIAFLAAGWMSSSLVPMATTTRVVYVPTSWGMQRERPKNIERTETLNEALTLADAGRVLYRYAGKRLDDQIIYPPHNGRPAMVYIKPADQAGYDVFLLPNAQCCSDPVLEKHLVQN